MPRLRFTVALAALVGCAPALPQPEPAQAQVVVAHVPEPPVAAPIPDAVSVPPPSLDAATMLAPLAASPRPPPLGWSSWSRYHREVHEGEIRAQADVLAARFAPLGFAYVNIDGGWFHCCDEHGRVKADEQKFPSGIPALAAYVHGKGLKLGVYLHPGVQREAWQANGLVAGTKVHIRDITDVTRPGNTKESEPSYAIDYSKPGASEYIQGYANLLASWGVDYLKLDFIGSGRGSQKADNREDVAQWSAALQKTGRPIWFELSLDLDFAYASFWKAHANGWRINHDIEAYHGNVVLTNWSKVVLRFESAARWAPFAGPGGWNDLDSLEVGNGETDGLTPDERRTTMTLWAIACSPLFLGADLTRLDPGDLALLTNAEVLAVDQSGHVATPIGSQGRQQVWRAANGDGSLTVALFNLGDETDKVAVRWSDLGLSSAASARNLWTHQDLGRFDGGYATTLASHASELLRVYP
jgi:alpha-galactosidase